MKSWHPFLIEGRHASAILWVVALLMLSAVAVVCLVCLFSQPTQDEMRVETLHCARLIAETQPTIVRSRSKPKEVGSTLGLKRGEAVQGPSEAEQSPAFGVGGRKFRSLQEAVDAAKDGETVMLTADACVRNPVSVRKNLNFDLNGFRLVAKNPKLAFRGRSGRFAEGAHAITVFGDSHVTVENGFIDIDSNGGTGGFSGAVERVPDPMSEAASAPTNDDWEFDVVLRDLEVTTDAPRDAAFRNAEGKMLIDNCTVRSTGGNGSYTIGQEAETTIRDCTFNTTGTDGEYAWWNNTVAVAFDGRAVVESGTYVTRMSEGVEGTTYGTYVYSSGGSIEVRDGEFQADQVVRADRDLSQYGDGGVSEVVVKDGALSGRMVSAQTGAEQDAEVVSGVSAYGGVYDNAPNAEQLPEGKTVVDYGDGTYSVENLAEAKGSVR